MAKTHSFRFGDEMLNHKLAKLLRDRASGKYTIDKAGFISYSHEDEDLIANDLISAIRAHVFPSWQVIAFPPEWETSYRKYMLEHKIPFQEETRDGERRFLIQRARQPYRWVLEQPSRNGK